MAIKRGSKVEINGSSASMTDLMFLLLIFLLIATTLINSNALKLQLPQSTNMVSDKTIISVSISPDLKYFVDKEQVDFSQIEAKLKTRLSGVDKPIISLQSDEKVPLGEVIRVMNIAKNNNWQLNLATRQE